MDITTITAWWGAITGTAVLVWDIYKWSTDGPKLHVSAQPNMKSRGMPEHDDKDLIAIHVSNYGSASTSITTLGFVHYSNLWAQLTKHADTAFVVAVPSKDQPIPFELRPGSVPWTGIVHQDPEVKNLLEHGRLVCQIYVSHRQKPFKVRVRGRSN